MCACMALHPCLVSHTLRHPCPSRYINRLHYRKPCKQPAKCLKSFLPLTDFVLYSITQNQISLSAKIAFLKKPPQKRWLFFIGEVPPKAPKCTGSEISANKCRYSDYNAYLWQPGQSSSYCNFLGNTLSRLSLAGLLHR